MKIHMGRAYRRLSLPLLGMLACAGLSFGAVAVAPASAQAIFRCFKPPCPDSDVKAPGGRADARRGFRSGKPDFSGRFRIVYSPIQCFRAPCPPGSYWIASRDKAFARRAERIVLKMSDGRPAVTYKGRYIGKGGLIVEGKVWLRGAAAYVEASRSREGKWDGE